MDPNMTETDIASDKKFNEKIDEIFTTLNITDKNDEILNKMKSSIPAPIKEEIIGNPMISKLINADKELRYQIDALKDSTYDATWGPLLKNLGKLQSYILLKSVPDEIQIDEQEAEIEEKEKDIAAKDKKIADKDQDIADKEKKIADKDQEIADKKQEIAQKDQEIADKEKKIADKDQEIAQKNQEIAQKDKEIAEKDKEIAETTQKIGSVNANKEIIDNIINALTHKIEMVNTLLTQNMTAEEHRNKYLKYKSKYLHVKKNIY